MAETSTNWASIAGIFISLWGIIAAPASITQIIYVLNRRSGNNKPYIIRSLFILILGVGRFFGSLFVGGILFFQGWKLDPVMQFAFVILIFGLIIESSSGVLKDRKEWKARKIIKK